MFDDIHIGVLTEGMGRLNLFVVPERLHLPMQIVQAPIRRKALDRKTQSIAKTLTKKATGKLVKGN